MGGLAVVSTTSVRRADVSPIIALAVSPAVAAVSCASRREPPSSVRNNPNIAARISFLAPAHQGDGVDLDRGAARERAHLHGGPRRPGSAQLGAVYLVYRGKVA